MSISRRSFLRHSAAAGLALTVAPSHIFAQDASRFKLIRRNVGTYTNRGGTIGWMVNSDCTVAVDSQYPDTAADCVSGLMEKRAGTIDCLINTHHHGDHTGGNGAFRAQTRDIVAHVRVPELQAEQHRMRSNATEPTVANITFETSWNAAFGDEQVSVAHHGAAHTGGDAVIHFQNANVVHMGDLVFNRVYPFIDRPGGASIPGWIAFLETVVKEHDSETIYIFGHGQPTFGITGKQADVLHMRDYLSAVWTHVVSGSTKGESREEIISVMSLKGFEDYASFGPRLSLGANLEVAYDEMMSGK